MAKAVVGKWRSERALARFNRRTQFGRFASELRAELLSDHPNASAAKILAIDAITFSALNLAQLSQQVAKGIPLTAEQAAESRAWLLTLRSWLALIGVERTEQAPPALAELLAEKRRKAAA